MTADLKMCRKAAYLLGLGLFLAAPDLRAAGFAVADQGAGASGIANAATARLDLPEAAFFNPTGYLYAPGGRVALGSALISPDISHTSPSTGVSTAAQTPTSVIPHLHAGYTFDDPRIAVSLYAGVPFGSGISWDEDWTGRFEVTELSLRVFETGLNVGWAHDLGPAIIGFAAGPRILASNVELRRRVDAVDTEGSVRIVGDDRAVSAQASVSVASIWGNIGLSYRPRVTLDYAGQADFQDIPIELQGRARDQDVTTSVTLPDRIATGLALNAFGIAIVSLDVEVFLWSTFDSFDVDFSADETPDVSQPRDWKNTVTYRAGLESNFRDLWGFDFRAGFAWDPTPSPTDTLSPTSPDSDRLILTTGVTWKSNFGLGADLAAGYVSLADTEATGDEAFPGEYSGSAFVLNFGANYRF